MRQWQNNFYDQQTPCVTFIDSHTQKLTQRGKESVKCVCIFVHERIKKLLLDNLNFYCKFSGKLRILTSYVRTSMREMDILLKWVVQGIFFI